ncbi:MAG: HlyD family efflux transporter periplasmic adaptor subunit [Lysobacter sp.]|nr:HlyD family efflux transporter periplasmic adaptor subunit [Lysobacter sp.]
MTESLFRQEVLDERKDGLFGQISLIQPVRTWVLAACAAAFALALILFLVFGSYTRRNRVSGQLVPVRGLATVVSPAAGLLGEVHVAEGDRVAAGDVLAVVQVPRATVEDGDTSVAMQSRLRTRAESLESAGHARALEVSSQLSGLDQQLQFLSSQAKQLESEIELRQKQVSLANETLARYVSLRESRYVGELQVEQQQSAVIEQTLALRQMQRQATEMHRQIADLKQRREETRASLARTRAEFNRDRAELEQEFVQANAAGGIALVAPVNGGVAGQMLKVGEPVREGQAVMSVIPGDGRLEAQLLVPSRAIGFIREGDPVLLRYQAYPHQKFGHYRGRVSLVSRSVMDRAVAAELAGDNNNEPYYRVSVEIERQAIEAMGKQQRLRPGMLLEADILGERRQLWEWVFEPIQSLAGNLDG